MNATMKRREFIALLGSAVAGPVFAPLAARGQPMHDGYIIDGWRQCGRLTWFRVKEDTYPWKEDPVETAWVRETRSPVSQKTRRATARPKASASLDRSPAASSAN